MIEMAKYLARACPRCNGYLGVVLREPERNTGLRCRLAGILLDATIVSNGNQSIAKRCARPCTGKRSCTGSFNWLSSGI